MCFSSTATVFLANANPEAIQAARDRGEIVVVLKPLIQPVPLFPPESPLSKRSSDPRS